MNAIEKCIKQDEYGKMNDCELCKEHRVDADCKKCPCVILAPKWRDGIHFFPCVHIVATATGMLNMPFKFSFDTAVCDWSGVIVRSLLVAMNAEMNKRGYGVKK